MKTLFNIEWFESVENIEENEPDILDDKMLKSGDIVYIKNKHSGAFLTISDKNLSD